MPYRMARIDVHKKRLAVVVADVEVEDEYQFERRWYGSNPEQLRVLSEWLIEQQVEDVVMLSAEPDIHLLSKTPKTPHRRLSLCSLPVPKQTEGSLWSCLRRPARHLRDLAACAPNDPDVLYSQAGFLRCRGASKLLDGAIILFSALDGEHVGNHLPGYGERRPVLVPSLLFPFINQRQLMVVSRSQFRGLHQRLLNVLVPLFGDGHSNELVRGASLRAAESAIADGLLDRLEA